MDASVKAVKKASAPRPASSKGDFDLTRDSGTLYANTRCGISAALGRGRGKITGAALPIAKDEIKTGKATILATVSGNETREYDIEIEKIYSPSGSTRNLLLRVTGRGSFLHRPAAWCRNEAAAQFCRMARSLRGHARPAG